MFTLCCWFDKKLELRLMVVSVLLKIIFRHTTPKLVNQKSVCHCRKQTVSTLDCANTEIHSFAEIYGIQILEGLI